jgi:hypothetical protein
LRTTIRRVEEVDDQDHFLVAIRTRPILALNLFILAFNWFVSCHNLYGLVLVRLLRPLM